MANLSTANETSNASNKRPRFLVRSWRWLRHTRIQKAMYRFGPTRKM
jgi:hypothetical protein